MEDRPVRREGIEIHPVADGYVVYDPARDRVHHLNHTAALVLEFCNSENTNADIAGTLQTAYKLSESVGEQVDECIEQLRRQGLLHDSAAERRPRLVMLVTNFIEGDSRVQKAARSAAAAGWEVTLLGRSWSGRRGDYRLGEASVIRLPVPALVTAYRQNNPPRGMAGRLGYRCAEQAAARRDLAWARHQDLVVERYLAELGPSSLAGRVRLAWLAATDRARGIWADTRRRHYERNRTRAAKATRPSARIARAVAGHAHDAGAWRTHPILADYEVAYGPIVDRLQPDIVHAHDVDTLAIGARAKVRAARAGRTVKLVYDAHEYVAGWYMPTDPAFSRVMAAQERKHIHLADAVVTVSTPIAELLRDAYGLADLPAVVQNAPPRHGDLEGDGPVPDIRSVLGLDDEPLLVYLGSIAPQRGLDTAIAALPELAGVHLALVTARNPCVTALEEQAVILEVRDRLHVLPYVAPQQIVAHVRTASLGIITLLSSPNVELSLPSKYYEYLGARLPVVVSNRKAIDAFTRELGNGEVFAAGDVTGFTRAVRTVLADPEKYARVYDDALLERHSWEAEVPILLGVYERISGVRDARGAAGQG